LVNRRSSPTVPDHRPGCQEEKSRVEDKPHLGLSWPEALRQVRSWLEPAIMLKRYWCAFSPAPPPFGIRELLDWLRQGNGINVYSTT
jgi:hypothetical protein